MTPESPAIRVLSLTSVLGGSDPVEFIHRLFESGYRRFYVKVPKGFRISISNADSFPPLYQLPSSARKTQPLARIDAMLPEVRYLQLTVSQLRDLLEHHSVNLDERPAGCLTSARSPGGLLPIKFNYRNDVVGYLVPIEAATANDLPTEFRGTSASPVVVKELNRARSRYSYVIHGVTLKDVYVEELALSKGLENSQPAEAGCTSTCEDLPHDPYELKGSSPLVFEILCKANKNRGKARNEIDVPSIAAEFRELNAGYKRNPKPFNDGRHDFAANLANPTYKYSSESLRDIPPPKTPLDVPADVFFDQDFVNHIFKKVLYAACCWSGAKEPRLEGNLEGLVDLLVKLGFFDADDSDQVQSLIFFITGEKYQRSKQKSEFRHIRRDRE